MIENNFKRWNLFKYFLIQEFKCTVYLNLFWVQLGFLRSSMIRFSFRNSKWMEKIRMQNLPTRFYISVAWGWEQWLHEKGWSLFSQINMKYTCKLLEFCLIARYFDSIYFNNKLEESNRWIQLKLYKVVRMRTANRILLSHLNSWMELIFTKNRGYLGDTHGFGLFGWKRLKSGR